MTAIVLGSVDLGEADRLVQLLTRERGRVTARARGARKSRKRYGGRLDRYALVRAQLKVHKDGAAVRRAAMGEVDLLRPFLGIRNDLSRTAMADHLVELLRIATHEEEPSPALFGLAVQALEVLETHPEPPREGWLRALVMAVLQELGLGVVVDHCCVCGAVVQRFPAGFSAAAGGVLCAEHGPGEPGAARLTRADHGRLCQLASADLADPGAAPLVNRHLRGLLARFVEYHLGRRMRTTQFLDTLLDEEAGPG